jgi:single-strand DNA-binding protein
MLSNVSIVGYTGRDAELKTTDGGPMAKFSLAVNEKWRKDGEETTTWYNVTCFGKSAQFAGDKIKRGDLIFVTGRLSLRAYKGKDGTDKISPDVNCFEWRFMPSGGRDETVTEAVGNEFGAPVKVEDDLLNIPF